ncbi:Uncharacterised protein [Mycobacteroides abscessus subsp. abscessus]|nr:Uncharacterised protein [Mycobacteroides abscessus subsp. abscessus]
MTAELRDLVSAAERFGELFELRTLRRVQITNDLGATLRVLDTGVRDIGPGLDRVRGALHTLSDTLHHSHRVLRIHRT